MLSLFLTVNSQFEQLTCDIYIPDSKQLYKALYNQKTKIETELAEELVWEELPNKKASKIKLVKSGNLFDQEQWENYHKWMLDSVLKLQKVFSKYIKQYAN